MDSYDRTARLYPALITAAPLTASAGVLATSPSLRAGLAALIAAVGLNIIAIHVVRDLGTRIEGDLWDRWGGPPTTQLLRWRDADDVAIHSTLHREVSAATGVSLPNQSDEATDPSVSDKVYWHAAARLRERTRSDNFPRVRTEVAQYGFRRNLLGCKPWGVGVAVGVLVGCCLAEAFRRWLGFGVEATSLVYCAAFAAVWLTGWFAIVTDDFVRTSAFRYARALLDAASGPR